MKWHDVRTGDHLKFVKRSSPDVTFTVTMQRPASPGYDWMISETFGDIYVPDWTIELLDRPLPPIDEELLNEAVERYWEGWGNRSGKPAVPAGVSAVINFVRDHDSKNATKENSK